MRYFRSYSRSLGLKSFLKPSQTPVEYTACAAKYVAQWRLINHKNQLCPHRYPFTPGWREAIIVKCLAQGHKCHDRDSNPHSAEQNQQSLNSVLLSALPRHPINRPVCKNAWTRQQQQCKVAATVHAPLGNKCPFGRYGVPTIGYHLVIVI